MRIIINDDDFKMTTDNLNFVNDYMFQGFGPNFQKGVDIALRYLKDLALGDKNSFRVDATRVPSELYNHVENTQFDCFLVRLGYEHPQFRLAICQTDVEIEQHPITLQTLLAEYVDPDIEANRKTEVFMDLSVFTSLRSVIVALASAAKTLYFWTPDNYGGWDIAFEFVDAESGQNNRIMIGTSDCGWGPTP